MSDTPGFVCRRRAISPVTLKPGKLAAFAGLGTLCDLDLQLLRVRGVRRRDAEAARRDLADLRRAAVLVARGVLAALAAVRAGAIRLNAIAIVSCASAESEQWDMPPLEKLA